METERSCFDGLFLVALATLVGCQAAVEPEKPPETGQYKVSVTTLSQLVDRSSGAIIDSSFSTWTGVATAREGRFTSLSSEFVPASIASVQNPDVFQIPDSTLTQALVNFDFTPGPNPQYVAPAVPYVPVDTITAVDQGINHVVISNWASWGNPLRQQVYHNGTLFQDIVYTWTTLPSGAVQLYRVRVDDYSDPNGVIRTTITVTSGTVVTLTMGHPPVGQGGTGLSRALASVGAGIRPLLSYCATLATDLLLPNALHAEAVDACGWAKALYYVAGFGVAVSSAAVWATRPTPYTPAWWAARIAFVGTTAGFAKATLQMTQACR
jgi:hypothetical protein